MLTINDEQLVKRLREIAEREHRSVEDVLKLLVTGYNDTQAAIEGDTDPVTGIRHKVYAEARRYWQTVRDTEKESLTDEELADQFAAFDEEGIPRLRSELATSEPPEGSLARMAETAEQADIRTGNSVDPATTDDILNEEFANYLLKRMNSDDATK